MDLENFELRPNSMGGELGDRVAALDEKLPQAGVGRIMADANRRGSTGDPHLPCNEKAADDEHGGHLGSVYKSICFTGGDNATRSWTPQGVTTVADAQDDQSWGGKNQPVLVSWYDSAEDSTEKGVRVSFVDPGTGRYRHVLLVYPTSGSDYMSLRYTQNSDGKSLHAGGITWYGNFLYVADTDRGFRVFDMRHIYDLGAADNGSTADHGKVGRVGDTYYGHGYRYVMPQVASWTTTASAGKACSGSDGAMSFSYTSLDRSSVDHMLAGEYCNGSETSRDGRVAAWPIAGSLTAGGEQITDTGYRWKADAAHKLPVSNVQGATRFNDRWYLSRSHGEEKIGTLYQTAKTSGSAETLQFATYQPAAIGPEDLSHWQNGTGGTTLGTIWTVAEHAQKRMLYATVPEEIAG